MKSTFGFGSRLGIADNKIKELEYKSIEITQT